MKRILLFAAISVFAFTLPIQAEEAPVVAVEKSLYERLGGEAAIKAVVDDFVPRAAANPAVNFTRQGQPRTWEATPENVEKLKKHLVQFVSMATGASNAVYEGRDMVAAHQGLNISDAEFDALAADLATSCDTLGVPAKEKAELLAVAGSTRGSIVQAEKAHESTEIKQCKPGCDKPCCAHKADKVCSMHGKKDCCDKKSHGQTKTNFGPRSRK